MWSLWRLNVPVVHYVFWGTCLFQKKMFYFKAQSKYVCLPNADECSLKFSHASSARETAKSVGCDSSCSENHQRWNYKLVCISMRSELPWQLLMMGVFLPPWSLVSSNSFPFYTDGGASVSIFFCFLTLVWSVKYPFDALCVFQWWLHQGEPSGGYLVRHPLTSFHSLSVPRGVSSNWCFYWRHR